MLLLPLRFRVIVIIMILMIISSVIIINRGTKPKEEYTKIEGKIAFINKQLGDLPNRDLGKYRYIKIDNYPYAFELFIGKESGDFKPKYENVDCLSLNDTVSIYCYETNETQKIGVNRYAQFIEKKDKLYFERGDSSKIIGLSIMTISVLMIIVCFVLMKQGKIKY